MASGSIPSGHSSFTSSGRMLPCVPVPVEDIVSVPLFANLSSTELASLAASADRIEVASGTELAREGDFGHSLFVVVQGTARVTIDGSTVRELGAGDLFGEVAVLASGRRTASVTAMTAMTLMTVFKRDVWELEQHNPDFSQRLRALTAV